MRIQDLGGEWEVSRQGSEDWLPATVPGNIHTDLQSAGRIDDPFVEDNEFRQAWVGEADWVYRHSFVPDDGLLDHDRVLLEMKGLDTLAEIKLNGEKIASTDNMFRRYEIDVTGKLLPGENTIEIVFRSPVKHVEPLIGSGLCISPNVSLPGSPYVRKAACHWGWDWGPALVTAGIWRPIRLVAYDIARIEDIHVRQRPESDGSVVVGAKLFIMERLSDELIAVNACLISPTGEMWEQTLDLSAESTEPCVEFVVGKPDLWWPNGYGEQPMYELQVELGKAGADARALQSVTRRIGLRTVELVQDEDQWGRTFYFKVNGVPIFAKGANWIPAHHFPSQLTDEWYRDLIESAASANMNMLRVWGGGFYEDDLFYDLCDEHGILVWQDFMFSCGHYPMNKDFLLTFLLEGMNNIARISHHPCLALWCGNNEMEWGVCDWWPEDREARQKEYARIFHDLLPKMVNGRDPDTAYWPSSPASPAPFDNPNSENEGDGHYWDVWHGRQPFTAYRDRYFRFMSEFGFQSLPSMQTVKTFAQEKDWNMTSHVMECHQKNPAGNGLILHYMAQNFRFPKDFPMTVYATQLLQAEAIRYGVEHWRRQRNDFRCMGTLYWQLNDCWPVASWSSIEFNRHWKALQYYAKRFFAPVLLSAEESDSSVKLHVTNDKPQPLRGGMVLWSLETLDGMPLDEHAVTLDVPGLSNALVADLDFSQYLNMDSRRNLVLVYELWQDGEMLSRAMMPFTPSKHLELPEPNLSVTVTQVGNGRCPVPQCAGFHELPELGLGVTVTQVENRRRPVPQCVGLHQRNGTAPVPYFDMGATEIRIKVSAEKAARFVMLDMPEQDLRFSDNFFDIPAGRSVEVKVLDAKGLSVKEIEAGLKVISLRDSY